MFPLEIVTMLGGAIVGGVLKIMDKKQEREGQMLAAITTGDQLRMSASVPEGMQWTRRLIALTIVFAVMVLPKLAYMMGFDIAYGTVSSTSFFFGLFGTGPGTVFDGTSGLPITPADTHSLAAVVGLYFGGRR